MTDPISNERLLPCPFCGGKAHLKESVDQDGPYVWVECYCGVDAFYTSSSSSHGVQFRDKNLAIAAWNRRPSPDTGGIGMDRTDEELRAVLDRVAVERTKWGLPSDYPIVAKSYSDKRSQLAKDSGLGRK